MTGQAAFALPCGGRVGLTTAGAAVARTDALGLTVWTVPAVDAADPFVALALENDFVIATSWRGVEHRIALTDGTIVSTTFVK